MNLGAGGMYPGGLIVIALVKGGAGTAVITFFAVAGGFIVIALENGAAGGGACFF